MRIAILGAGSLGILFGCKLYQSGNSVILYNRNASILEAARKGVRLREHGRTRHYKIPIRRPPSSLHAHDLVIITTKAYDTQGIARSYAHKIEPEVKTILTLQNGLGNYEALARSFGRRRVLAGSTTEAARMVRPGLVHHTGIGETWIGEFESDRESSRSNEISRLFNEAGLHANVSNNIGYVVWQKAIVNSAINPLSALTGLRNGRLRSNSLRRIIEATIREGTRVAQAEGIPLKPNVLLDFTMRVLQKTAKNHSSMLQDIESGRQTEIGQLNGMIVRLAKHHGLPTPLNQSLARMVKSLESNLDS